MRNDNKDIASQRDIIENILLGTTPQEELVEETVEVQESEDTELTEEVMEQIVLEFLQTSLGNSLNEGTEEDRETAIVEAVTNLNYVTAIVNSYFGLD